MLSFGEGSAGGGRRKSCCLHVVYVGVSVEHPMSPPVPILAGGAPSMRQTLDAPRAPQALSSPGLAGWNGGFAG